MLIFTLVFLTLPLFCMKDGIESRDNRLVDIKYEHDFLLLMAMGKLQEANFKFPQEANRPVIIPQPVATRDWAKKKKNKS